MAINLQYIASQMLVQLQIQGQRYMVVPKQQLCVLIQKQGTCETPANNTDEHWTFSCFLIIGVRNPLYLQLLVRTDVLAPVAKP